MAVSIISVTKNGLSFRFIISPFRSTHSGKRLTAFAIAVVAGAILLKEVIKYKMKFVAFLGSTALFLFIIVSVCAQDSQSIAAYRAGHYSGTALNTTVNQHGKVVFDLYDLDSSSGRVRAYFAASDGLEGEAWLEGRIDKAGELRLKGALAQLQMDVEARLTSATTIKANYSLAGKTNQAGTFEVTLTQAFDQSTNAGPADRLIGAWEVGGGLPMQTNPITGMTSGISFVDARRLEILPDGEFKGLHSHEHCQGSGMARCCLQTATLETGTVTIDENQIAFRITGGDNVARDNCQPRLNQQSHVSPKTEIFAWTIQRGPTGISQLCLQGGSESGRTCYQRQS